MADFSFRVTPAVLQQKAGEFSDIVKEIKSLFDQIEEISGGTKGYWHGEAGDKDREGYASYKDDIAWIVGRLEEHPTDLLKIAGIYSGTETKVSVISQQLGTSGIV